MTAGVQAAAGCAAANGLVVTVAVGSDGSVRGYDVDSTIGSRSPTSYLGNTIEELWVAIVSGDFRLRLSGGASTAFSYIRVQSDSSSVVLTAASATFSNPSGKSQWAWSSTGIAWTNESTRTVTFVR